VNDLDRYNNDDDGIAQNALKGGTLLRFVDGVWSDKDRNPISTDTQLLVHEIDVILQRWKDGVAAVLPRDPVTSRLADPDQLNEQIPESEWERDLNNNWRPPWERTFCVYLVDMGQTGQKFSFINATAGASMAYGDLKSAMQTKRFLHGIDLFPIVELRSKMWKPKKFAQRLRPYFHPVDWIRPGGGHVPAIAGPNPPAGPVKQIAAPAKQITAAEPAKTAQKTREILDDTIPFN
jgi:hypothetical protein